MFIGISEIMYFVPNRLEAAHWYAKLFGTNIIFLDNPDYFFLRVGGQEVWFHVADKKTPNGAAGQVAYWQVLDFESVMLYAQELGAELYRGPLDRKDGTFMCQVKDPYGNLIGIFGPKPATSG